MKIEPVIEVNVSTNWKHRRFVTKQTFPSPCLTVSSEQDGGKGHDDVRGNLF